MSESHLGIVWNPSKTSRADLEAALQDVLEGVQQRPRVSWLETSEDDPGGSAAREALEAGADAVCAAGGDGTVRAVAECLAETGGAADLVILPLGTGNLLARNLGVPLGDPAAAFRQAFTDAVRTIDVGWAEIALPDGVERHAFAVMAGFGLDAHMITETDEGFKDRAGWLAYIESLGRALSASEVIGLDLSFDGAETVREQAHTLIVGNCGALQGGVTLLPDADPGDGELDVLVLSADGIGGWVDTLRNMAWDNGLKRLLTRGDTAESSRSASHGRFTALTVELEEPRAFEVDGDELGEVTRVDIAVQPAALRVRLLGS